MICSLKNIGNEIHQKGDCLIKNVCYNRIRGDYIKRGWHFILFYVDHRVYKGSLTSLARTLAFENRGEGMTGLLTSFLQALQLESENSAGGHP